MGTQLWWLYDVVAVAIFLVCIYLSGRKGIFKSLITAVGCILSVFISVSISGTIADRLYKTTVRDGNINKLEKTLLNSTKNLYS